MRQYLWIVLLLAYATGIAILSHQPLTGVATGVSQLDKLFHFAEFAVFMFLAWKATGRRWGLALVISLLYAATDELHQAFVTSRDASGWDFLADSLGILFMGWVLRANWGLWHSLRRLILGRNRQEEGD